MWVGAVLIALPAQKGEIWRPIGFSRSLLSSAQGRSARFWSSLQRKLAQLMDEYILATGAWQPSRVDFGTVGGGGMTLDILLLQLAIVFLPGLVWARVDACYAKKEKPSNTDFVLNVFLFGVVSYVVVFIGYYLFDLGNPVLYNSGASGDIDFGNKEIVFEISVALMVSVVLSVLWVYASTYKLFTRFLQLIKATKRYGDEDVWDYVFNSGSASVEYVHVRDMEKEYVYAGWVRAFSETGKLRELMLTNVQVYDFAGTLLFEVPSLYVAKPTEGMVIEFPFQP